MTVESNYVIAIATLSDWRQFFNQWEANPIAPCTRDFSRASGELQVIARNCDWFIALPAPVVIGQSDYFGFGFSTVIWKPLYIVNSKNIITGCNMAYMFNAFSLKVPFWWFVTEVSTFTSFFRRQRCRVVRAPDLKSGDPEFKSRSDHWLDLFLSAPGSTPRLVLC